jgi:hypothetical protein
MKCMVRLLVCWGLALTGAQGAQTYNESFEAGASAGDGSFTLQAGAWAFTGAVACAKMLDTTPFAMPDTAVLKPTSAAFTGDYVQAGIKVIGFRFSSGSPRPSHLYLELTAGTSVYQRVFPVAETSGWQSYMASLASFEAGGWTVKKGSRENFTAALRDVKSVEVKIRRAGAPPTEHVVDSLFVDGPPQVAGSGTSGGGMTVTWDTLQVGAPYVLQKAGALAGPWTDTAPVNATNRLQQVPLPIDGASGQSFFRLRGP